MSFSQDTATEKAKEDLAARLKVKESEVDAVSVAEKDFPDMSLGAPVEGEMSAQMISSGWTITLGVDDEKYEYRADKYQLRLVNFEETNHLVVS